ncbi:30 kDa heat shock protein [Madurella mycetomatis]|uniref:30 kDa heat shock protein n=1 Tax=Madurella mycetomatis TaxID=100816 RepID=A0A175W4N5_9PEZI|nr:30 kDa heat shock protein [Madurella mycetomatis]
MMSFFPRSFCAPATTDVSFTPLFRLLEDYDNYSREVQNADAGRQRRPRQARSGLATFTPKFDVGETENTYELHGEFPGLQRENVNIEFTEPQTIVIRGRVERTYSEPNNSNTNAGTTTEPAEAGRRNSHQATVEDDPEDEHTPASTPATTPKPGAAKPAAPGQSQDVTKAPTQQEPKYWLWERSVGEFSRTFSFPTPVDHDNVTANLNNGILTVTVPKAKKLTARRIAIN